MELVEGCKPRVLEECDECGICREICPRVEMPYSAIKSELKKRGGAEAEDEFLGCYSRTFLSRSTDGEVREKGYCGGTTTGFLLQLLDKGLIDGTLLTGKVHNLSFCAHPKPKYARNRDEIISCAYTKPTVNPILAQLPCPGEKAAFVGCSCHIEAVRKAQFLAERGGATGKRCEELVGNLRYLIGLNCFFANNPQGVETQLKRIGLTEKDIKRFFYLKGTPAVELPDGTIRSDFADPGNLDSLNLGCLLCYPSYTAPLSDLTTGKTMTEAWGWNDAIPRSREIDELLKEMEAEGKLETSEPPKGGEEILEGLLEAQVFKTDAMGYGEYLKTGNFKPREGSTSMLGGGQGGTIKGVTRLRLIQAVRQFAMFEPAMKAREEHGVFVPKLT
jgi:coenzyme F420-reducing hydrogenase beta subunit